jgi:hypothetical protein
VTVRPNPSAKPGRSATHQTAEKALDMQYRTLGKTGIKVSPYCLGAMMFGGIANADHDDGIRIIHKALDFGVNLRAARHLLAQQR